MKRLLVTDDEAPLVQLLSEYLTRAGYEVLTAFDGATALRIARDKAPDLIVLDVRMPGMDGWQTLKELRLVTSAPVIMLTALNDEPYVLRGFSLGADDYVAKPFSFAQLEARIRAVIQRASRADAAQGLSDETELLEAGDLVVDKETCRVRRGGEIVELTPTEFKLLVVLMEHPGRVLSPGQLVTRVWGQEYADDTGYVRRYIWHLRRKVERRPDEPRYIHNARNFGYYFQAPERP